MDNDIQVNQQVIKAKDSFLSVPFSHEPAGGDVYDLEREFSSTRKNKNYFVTFLMLGFLGVVTAGVWILYSTVEAQNQNFEVQVADFEALRIREAFDALQKDRALVAELAREVQRIQDEYRREEERLSLDLKARKETLLQSGAEDAQDAAAQLDRENRALLADIRDRYLPQLEEKQKTIQELELKVKAQETELEPSLAGREAFSNNQQKLFDRQKEDLARFYEDRLARQRTEWNRIVQQQERSRAALIRAMNERRARELAAMELKYNPREERPEFLSLMERLPQFEPAAALPIPETMVAEGAVSKELLEGITGNQEDLLLLLSRLREVPYVNSVPGLLKSAETLAQDIFAGAEKLLPSAEAVLLGKNRELAEREVLIETLKAEKQELEVRRNREMAEMEAFLVRAGDRIGGDGYILELTGPRDYRLVLKNPGSYKPGDRLLIRRTVSGFGGTSDMEVGELELTERKALWSGRLVMQKQPTILPDFQDRLLKK